MPEAPITFSRTDVEKPTLLERLVRKIVDAITSLRTRVSNLETAPPDALPISDIRDALQSTGQAPLNISNLLGTARDPQTPYLAQFTTEPTGQVLQALRDGQLIFISGTTTLKRVSSGNPNTLADVVSSGSSLLGSNNTWTGSNVFSGAFSVTATSDFNASALFQGGIQFHVEIVTTSPFTATTASVYISVNRTVAGATTVNLPATPNQGQLVFVKDDKGDAGANNITIQGNGKNIDGAGSKVISSNLGVFTLIYNGTQWNSV